MKSDLGCQSQMVGFRTSIQVRLRRMSFQHPKPLIHLTDKTALGNTGLSQQSYCLNHSYKLPWPLDQPSIFVLFRLCYDLCYKSSIWPRGLPLSSKRVPVTKPTLSLVSSFSQHPYVAGNYDYPIFRIWKLPTVLISYLSYS